MKPYIFLLIFPVFLSCKNDPICESISLSVPYKTSKQIAKMIEESDQPWIYQLAAWEYSYIGDYQKMAETWDKDRGPRKRLSSEDSLAFLQNYQPQNALEYIIEQASGQKVVMINEAHHQPLHRVFTTSLLQPLYDQGFRYLGLETLNHDDSLLNQRKYPIFSSGTYIVEPQFANLVREALAIGYELFPYESQDHSNGTQREINQARNIQAFVEAHPEGKFLIHAGFAHIIEGEYPAWGKAMAGRFEEFTGIDPYTINQTEWTQSAYETYNDGYYQIIQEKVPSVFIDQNGSPFTHPVNPDWYDLRVFHPRWEYESGRPTWLQANGKRLPYSINPPALNFDPPYLVMAYSQNEDLEKAVPMDIAEWKDSMSAPILILPPGEYQVVIQNADSTGCKFIISNP